MAADKEREKAFNIIAGIILANRDFTTAEKTELLKHLRETEGTNCLN